MTASAPHAAPGPRGTWPFGSFFDEAKDPLGFIQENQRRYGDVFLFRIGGRGHCVLSHPDDVKRVLIDEPALFPKPRMPPSLFAGKGLFGSEGEYWKKHRRMIQPAFQRERLLAWVDTITDATRKMLDRWEPLARSGQPVDVYEEFLRLAYTIQARLCLTTEPDDSLYASMHGAVRHIGRRDPPMHELVFGVLPFLSSWRQRMAAYMEPVNAFIYARIAERRRGEGVQQDLLQMLMELKDRDTGEGFTDVEVRDELMNIWGAGYEATGAGLAWSFALLDKNPEALARVEREAAEVLAGGLPTASSAEALSYTGQAFREALRIYPPAWRLERQATQDVEFRGVHVPAGTLVFMLSYVLHRDPRFWDAPERFDPERFSTERSVGRPKCSYLPFGAGQRTCLGNLLALLKGPLILAMVTQRYRVTPVSREEPGFDVGVTLSPRGGLPVRLTLR
jgi:cytochrome P450